MMIMAHHRGVLGKVGRGSGHRQDRGETAGHFPIKFSPGPVVITEYAHTPLFRLFGSLAGLGDNEPSTYQSGVPGRRRPERDQSHEY